MLFYFNDNGQDPIVLLLHSAQLGNIGGIERALQQGADIYFSENLMGMSPLHFAAMCKHPNGTETVRWLLEKGIPWNAANRDKHIPEQLAIMFGNKESAQILRKWAIQKEYEMYCKPFDYDRMSLLEKRYQLQYPGTVKPIENQIFCKSLVLYTNPNGAPDDEVAMVCIPTGCGIMMEWERPIMKETARLLLDGMPTKGLRVLNIGFGIGMIDTYFQDAHPAEHFIIEGHPTSVGWMRHKGWHKRPGVRILEGRWQDILTKAQYVPTKDDEGTLDPIDIGKFDIVYFDTFMEGYHGHVDFIKHIPRLLRGPGSRFSFFNGHAGKIEFVYTIYAEVARWHHNDLGMNTEWFEVDVDKKEMWYYLPDRDKKEGRDWFTKQLIPICALAPTVPRTLITNAGWNSSPSNEPARKEEREA